MRVRFVGFLVVGLLVGSLGACGETTRDWSRAAGEGGDGASEEQEGPGGQDGSGGSVANKGGNTGLGAGGTEASAGEGGETSMIGSSAGAGGASGLSGDASDGGSNSGDAGGPFGGAGGDAGNSSSEGGAAGESDTASFQCGDPLPTLAFPTVLTGTGSPPLPEGGTITEGLYVLTQAVVYGTYSSVPADVFELADGYIHSRHTSYSSSGSPLAGYEQVGTYATTGSAMAIDVVACGLGSGPGLWKFTASEDEIQLFTTESATTWVQTFRLQQP